MQTVGFPVDARQIEGQVFARINARYFHGTEDGLVDVTNLVGNGLNVRGFAITQSSFKNLPPFGTYWMVHKPGTACQAMHGTENAAHHEARRLTREFGGTFRVGEFKA